jgi:zinc transport system substrate-binding protein
MAGAALAGCDSRSTNNTDPGADAGADAAPQPVLRVTATIAPHAWLVRQIGGELVDVQVLVHAGDSPHTYQPSDAQISRVVSSQLFFRTGMPLERGPWIEAMHARGKGPRMVDLRDGVTLRTMTAACDHADGQHDHPHHHHDHHHHDAAPDPHIWLSPRALITQAANIAAALIDVAPEHAAHFADNLMAFTRAVEAVDARITEMLAPHVGRRFYIFHPAWGYFADDYRLVQVPVEIDGKEPTERELTVLQQQARADGARVIFVQPQIAGRTAEVLAAAIGGRAQMLDPLADDVLANMLSTAEVLAAAFDTARPADQPVAQPAPRPAPRPEAQTHEHPHE